MRIRLALRGRKAAVRAVAASTVAYSVASPNETSSNSAVSGSATVTSTGGACRNYEDVQAHAEQLRLQDGSTEPVRQGCCWQ